MIYTIKVIHYYQFKCLKTFEVNAVKYMLLIFFLSFIFFAQAISMTNSLKKDKSKIKLFTDIDMLLMVEKGIKGGI